MAWSERGGVIADLLAFTPPPSLGWRAFGTLPLVTFRLDAERGIVYVTGGATADANPGAQRRPYAVLPGAFRPVSTQYLLVRALDSTRGVTSGAWTINSAGEVIGEMATDFAVSSMINGYMFTAV